MYTIALSFLLAVTAINTSAADLHNPDGLKKDCPQSILSDSSVCVEILGVDNLDNIGHIIFNADSSSVSTYGSMQLKNMLKISHVIKGKSYILVLYPKEALSHRYTDNVVIDGLRTSVVGSNYKPVEYDDVTNKLAEVKFTIPIDFCCTSENSTSSAGYTIPPITINYK